MKCLKIRIALSDISILVFFAEVFPIFQETQWIGIPGRNIEIGPDIKMVKVNKHAHEIMHDVATRTVATDDIDLCLVERHDLI